MFKASITFHQGSEREFGIDHTCATLEEAVRTIEGWAAGSGDNCRAWINNKEVRIQSCRVVDENSESFCINEKWHEIWAKPEQQIKPLAGADLIKAAMKDYPLRPVPTNPATPRTMAVKNGDSVVFIDHEDRSAS